jgi:branched-chain amino acid transport system substrate-binding protein
MRIRFSGRVLAISTLLFFTALVQAQIKVGFHAPLTGAAASDGQLALIGVQIAFDSINAKGGVLGKKLEIVSYDDQGQADQAIPIAHKLIGEDHVPVAISGSYSLPTRAASGIFQKAGVPYFAAFAVHPDVTAGGNFAFRGVSLAQIQGAAVAGFIAGEFGKKKVALISMDNDFGQAITEGFKDAAPRLGLTTKDFLFSLSERRFGTIIAQLKAENPDIIAITAYYFVGAPLLAQIRAAGLTQPIVGARALDSAQFIQIAKQAAEGVFVVGSLARDDPNPNLAAFRTEFLKRSGLADLDNSAAIAYDSAMIVADAIRRAGSDDPKKIRAALAATHDYKGLTGKVSGFSPTGEIYIDMTVTKISGGTYKFYKTIDDPILLKPKK